VGAQGAHGPGVGPQGAHGPGLPGGAHGKHVRAATFSPSIANFISGAFVTFLKPDKAKDPIPNRKNPTFLINPLLDSDSSILSFLLSIFSLMLHWIGSWVYLQTFTKRFFCMFYEYRTMTPEVAFGKCLEPKK
jgi:hypothetical protein